MVRVCVCVEWPLVLSWQGWVGVNFHGLSSPDWWVGARRCTRWSTRPNPRTSQWPNQRPSCALRRTLARSAFGSGMLDECLALILSRLMVAYLDELPLAKSQNSGAALGWALNIAAIYCPHHRSLLVPRSKRFHDAKVSDNVLVHWRNFSRGKVEKVRILVGIVRHQMVWDDWMRTGIGAEQASEVYMLVTLLEYIEGVRIRKEEGIERC